MIIDAILWDYDGTLVNSVPKNIAITKKILAEVTPHLAGDNLPSCLNNEELYHKAVHEATNWQDLYMNGYGMTEAEMLKAGSLWTPYQLKNTHSVQFFKGIEEVVTKISIPQAICSLNSSQIIKHTITERDLLKHFRTVVGYNDVPMSMQKPHAHGGLKCLQQLFNNPKKSIIYIGDHEVDVEFSRNIAQEIGNQHQVISVIVTYSGANTTDWKFQPDFKINKPSELLKIISTLQKEP